MPVDCETVAAHSLPELYLLGKLTAAEQEAYERHYFDCAQCLEDLNLLQAVQVELRESKAVAATEENRPRQSVWQPRWLWGGGMAIAAGVAGIALLVQMNRPAERVARQPKAAHETAAAPAIPRITGTPNAAGAGDSEASVSVATRETPDVPQRVVLSASQRAAVLARLARVEAPRYAPRRLRGAQDEAARAFEAGMNAYLRKDYGAAVAELQNAASLDADRPDVSFYLGATQLLLGNAAVATEELQRTIAMGDTPFVAPACFYLAKAQLRALDPDAARRSLQKALSYDTDLNAEAAAILRELDTMGSEHAASDDPP